MRIPRIPRPSIEVEPKSHPSPNLIQPRIQHLGMRNAEFALIDLLRASTLFHFWDKVEWMPAGGERVAWVSRFVLFHRFFQSGFANSTPRADGVRNNVDMKVCHPAKTCSQRQR